MCSRVSDVTTATPIIPGGADRWQRVRGLERPVPGRVNARPPATSRLTRSSWLVSTQRSRRRLTVVGAGIGRGIVTTAPGSAVLVQRRHSG
jgi:hypothetical protein